MVNIIMAPAHVKSSLGLVHKIVSSLTETNEQINCYKKNIVNDKKLDVNQYFSVNSDSTISGFEVYVVGRIWLAQCSCFPQHRAVLRPQTIQHFYEDVSSIIAMVALR